MLAGTGLNMALKDVPASISAMTADFPGDIEATGVAAAMCAVKWKPWLELPGLGLAAGEDEGVPAGLGGGAHLLLNSVRIEDLY